MRRLSTQGGRGRLLKGWGTGHSYNIVMGQKPSTSYERGEFGPLLSKASVHVLLIFLLETCEADGTEIVLF